MKKYFRKVKKNGGAAMLISIVFFIFISLAIVFGLVSPQVREFRNAAVNLNSKKSYFLAESGSEDAIYRIKKNKTIDSSETITLGSNSVTTIISNLPGSVKQIISLGDVSSYQRKSSLLLRAGDGEVFKYGTQAGQGGFVFHNNSYVLGSLYSNGNLLGTNGAYVTGDAFVAGSTGLIDNMCIGGIQGSTCVGTPPGSAHVHTITSTDVANNIFAVSATNSTAGGTIYCQTGSGNNKSCTTSPLQTDPPAENLPIPDADIAQWETDATNLGITNGNVTVTVASPVSLKGKVIGNLTINDKAILTITGTTYVTGNIEIIGSGVVKLDPSYGALSGILMSDGYIIINNNVVFQDSGTAGSYILLLSNSTCDTSSSGSPCFSHSAIDVGNNSNISIVNAQKGTVYFSNNAAVKESVGKKIELKNGVGISYGSGIINIGFGGGPGGAWEIDSWGESK